MCGQARASVPDGVFSDQFGILGLAKTQDEVYGAVVKNVLVVFTF